MIILATFGRRILAVDGSVNINANCRMDGNHRANGRNDVCIHVLEAGQNHKLEGEKGGNGKANYQWTVGHKQQDDQDGSGLLGLGNPFGPHFQGFHARELLNKDQPQSVSCDQDMHHNDGGHSRSYGGICVVEPNKRGQERQLKDKEYKNGA